jgi:hypothetical protein
MENNAIFTRLQNAPASVFKNITQADGKEASQAPENKPQPMPGAIAGQVSEAEALGASKGAEIDAFSDVSSTQQAGQGITPASPNSGKLGHLLTAKTAIGIVDAVIPAIAVIALQYFMGLKMQKRDLQLTEAERNIIQPVLQNWLDTVAINFDSPLNALLITVGAVYGSKFAEKGFTAYFEKREAEQANAKRMEQIKKELEPVVKEAPKPDLLDKNGKLKPATTEDTNEFGYTKEEMSHARKMILKEGKAEPNRKQQAAWLARQRKN